MQIIYMYSRGPADVIEVFGGCPQVFCEHCKLEIVVIRRLNKKRAESTSFLAPSSNISQKLKILCQSVMILRIESIIHTKSGRVLRYQVNRSLVLRNLREIILFNIEQSLMEIRCKLNGFYR